jgi:phosphatidylinositol glycan class M
MLHNQNANEYAMMIASPTTFTTVTSVTRRRGGAGHHAINARQSPAPTLSYCRRMEPTSPFAREIASAAFLRLLLLVYGAWHDRHLEVKYTDIDYEVFSDGAELVWHGQSPYERQTYRYTPFLALLLTPNAWAHPSWGKLLFAACDLAVGAQLYCILLERRVPRAVARGCAGAWLFNPLSLNVSTRGNAESVVLVLLLGSLHALLRRRAVLSGMLLGLAMHMKPYPVIYLPAFLASMDADFAAQPTDGSSLGDGGLGGSGDAVGSAGRGDGGADPGGLLARLTSCLAALGGTPSRAAWRARIAFAASLLCVYCALFATCWLWCGAAFYNEALLHHLTRADARHNFSPYFYALYLAPRGTLLRGLLSSLAFVPQAALLLGLAARFGRDLPFCIFVQTLVFVTFNKVCTAQYFVWYHGLLPLVLPSSAALLRQQRPRTLVAVAVWTATLLLWLGVAHQLEFRARNVFLPLWLAGLAFFFANVFLVHEAIRLHHSTPLFRGGRLARQACLYGADATGEHDTAARLLLDGLRSLRAPGRSDGARDS